MRRLHLLMLAGLFVAGAAGAVLPDEQLPDPAQEARAREISRELRCVVCQNQSIDHSDAPLARDLRLIVREQIAAGKSDREVKAYLVERYGNFVLLRPPFTRETWLLWLGPLLAVAAGGLGVAVYLKGRRAAAPPSELSPAELERLARLLGERESDV